MIRRLAISNEFISNAVVFAVVVKIDCIIHHPFTHSAHTFPSPRVPSGFHQQPSHISCGHHVLTAVLHLASLTLRIAAQIINGNLRLADHEQVAGYQDRLHQQRGRVWHGHDGVDVAASECWTGRPRHHGCYQPHGQPLLVCAHGG